MSKSRKQRSALAKSTLRTKRTQRRQTSADGSRPQSQGEVQGQPQLAPSQYLAALVEEAMAMRETWTTDRERWTAEVAQLKAVLEATRRHAFATQSAVLGSQQLARGKHQVVVWGVERAHRSVVDTLLASLPRSAVTVLLRPGTDPAMFVRGHEAGYSVMVANDDSPAGCWNQAFACTQTDALVFLHISAAPAGECAAQLACAALEDSVALSTPAILGRSTRTLGVQEQGQMQFAPVVSDERRLAQSIAFGSAQAFAMSRAAYHAVGCFDEALRTGLALADWTLRSRTLGLRCLGVASATVSAHPAIATHLLEGSESDRLILLARHRPEQVSAAVLTMPGVFQQQPEEVAATLRSVFLRLPHAAQFPAAAQLLAGQATAMAAAVRALPSLVAQVRAIAEMLDVAVDAEQQTDQWMDAIRTAIVAQLEQVSLLQAEVEELPTVRAQLSAASQEVGGLRERLIASTEALRAAAQAQAERDVAVVKLQTELEQARATMGRLESDLRAAEAAHDLLPRLQVLVEQSNERVVALEAELANRNAAIVEREVAMARLRGTAEALQEQVERLTRERDAIRGMVKTGG